MGAFAHFSPDGETWVGHGGNCEGTDDDDEDDGRKKWKDAYTLFNLCVCEPSMSASAGRGVHEYSTLLSLSLSRLS